MDVRERLEQILYSGKCANAGRIEQALDRLRGILFTYGMPDETEEEKQGVIQAKGGCSLRGRIWKALLRVKHIDAQHYIDLVEKGGSSLLGAIKDDSFRTFNRQEDFLLRVSEPKLVRLLNSFVITFHGGMDKGDFSYLQGMNNLCVPFLYIMPEVEAYFAFSKLIYCYIPLYVTEEYLGARAGCRLLDKCIELFDGELFSYLSHNKLYALSYAFKEVISVSSQFPPLLEVVKLWDFYVVFGFHLNIICIAARLVMIRDDLMAMGIKELGKQLQELPPIDATVCIEALKKIIPLVPEPLYDQLVRHLHDPSLCKALWKEMEHTVLQ